MRYKLVRVVIGPIDRSGTLYQEGDSLVMPDHEAYQFEKWAYVAIIGDCDENGNLIEPNPEAVLGREVAKVKKTKVEKTEE